MKMLIILFLLAVLIAVAACGQDGETEYQDPTIAPSDNGINNIDQGNGTEPQVPVIDIPSFDRYDASLTIEPATRTVNGTSRITFTNRTGYPLYDIVLRVYLNAFNEGSDNFFPEHEGRIFLHGREYGYMNIQHVTMNNEYLSYELDGTVLSLNLDDPIAPEQTVQLVLQFDAHIPMIAHRTGANDRALWFGMFLPVLAVYGDEGWIIPDYYPAGDPFIQEMAAFEVEIITPVDYIVAGTGVKIDDIPLEDVRVTIFNANNARDFTFAISPYFRHEWISTVGGDVHLYFYSDDLPVDEILDIIRNAMEHFSYRIGPYPFDDIRIIETDMFLDGMTFSNVIFMNTAALSLPNYMALARVLGHQWFSNIVGSNSVYEPWLATGLVRYVALRLLYNQAEALQERMVVEHNRIAARNDLYLTSGLGAFNTWRDYYQTHHIKSMLMFNALNGHMGDELFWELIHQYFQTYYFQIATGENLISMAEEIYGDSLADFFDAWLAGGSMPN